VDDAPQEFPRQPTPDPYRVDQPEPMRQPPQPQPPIQQPPIQPPPIQHPPPVMGAPGCGPAGQFIPTSGKAIAALVLGIASIPLCMLHGVPSLVCGGLAILFARQAFAEIERGQRHPNSHGLAKGGLICGIVGLSLGALYFFIFIAVIIFAIMAEGL
jgi:hypothetical protein